MSHVKGCRGRTNLNSPSPTYTLSHTHTLSLSLSLARSLARSLFVSLSFCISVAVPDVQGVRRAHGFELGGSVREVYDSSSPYGCQLWTRQICRWLGKTNESCHIHVWGMSHI